MSMLLTACGGSAGNGSSSDGGSSTGSDGSTSSTDDPSGSDGKSFEITDSSKPITPFTLEYESIGHIYKAGFNGDIKIIKGVNNFNNVTDYYWDYSLDNGALKIIDVQRADSMTFSCPASADELAGQGTSLVTYSYAKNFVIDKFESSGHEIDCSYKITQSYEVFKETSVAWDTDVIGLLHWGSSYNSRGNPENANGKNCPNPDDMLASYVSSLRANIHNYADCKVKIIRNFIMKDDTEKLHKLAYSIEK